MKGNVINMVGEDKWVSNNKPVSESLGGPIKIQIAGPQPQNF